LNRLGIELIRAIGTIGAIGIMGAIGGMGIIGHTRGPGTNCLTATPFTKARSARFVVNAFGVAATTVVANIAAKHVKFLVELIAVHPPPPQPAVDTAVLEVCTHHRLASRKVELS
jgi:hypothetical protein